MSKHTPGPWYINEHPYANQPEYVLAMPGKTGDDCLDVVSVAIVEMCQNTLTGWRSREECHANARLIAAAPKMLEALKQVRDWLHDYRGGMGVPQMQLILTAIEDAEGKK